MCVQSRQSPPPPDRIACGSSDRTGRRHEIARKLARYRPIRTMLNGYPVQVGDLRHRRIIATKKFEARPSRCRKRIAPAEFEVDQMTSIKKMALAATFALVSAFPASSDIPVQPVLIATGPGGSVVDFARRVTTARSQSTPVRFRGQCASACTLFLSLPTESTCISRGASFTFHRAYGASAQMNDWATIYMMERYPALVQRWINERGGLTDVLLHMNYRYALQFIPPCGPRGVSGKEMQS